MSSASLTGVEVADLLAHDVGGHGRVPGVVVLVVAGRHRHDLVAAAGELEGQGAHDVAEAAGLGPGGHLRGHEHDLHGAGGALHGGQVRGDLLGRRGLADEGRRRIIGRVDGAADLGRGLRGRRRRAAVGRGGDSQGPRTAAGSAVQRPWGPADGNLQQHCHQTARRRRARGRRRRSTAPAQPGGGRRTRAPGAPHATPVRARGKLDARGCLQKLCPASRRRDSVRGRTRIVGPSGPGAGRVPRRADASRERSLRSRNIKEAI